VHRGLGQRAGHQRRTDEEEDDDDAQPTETLRVKSDTELLPDIYWLLLTCSPRCNCVEAHPNRCSSAAA
jgi:hypothetical protein